MEISLKAYAKINLALDIINKRNDGYHNIKTIMQSIKLHDNISIEKTCEGISISTSSREIPTGRDNLAYIAAELFLKEISVKGGVKIYIEKNIPVAAGLAGGSTDAAAVLTGMNKLFDINMPIERLRDIGKRIGADVPYCLTGGTVLAEGTGDILLPLRRLKNISVLLVVPKIKVSTKWAYSNYNIQEKKYNFAAILEAIDKIDHKGLFSSMFNVFERLLLKEHPEIKDIKQELLRTGADTALMSGSGPAVFGFFEDMEKAKIACEIINAENRNIFLTELL